MKKFFKICTAMAVFFLIAGIGFLIAAWRGGATIPAVIDNAIQNFKGEEINSRYSFGSQGVRKLEIDMGGGNLQIQQGANDEISLENDGQSWVRAKMKDDGETLTIDEGRFASWLRRFRKPRGTAVLTLPKDMNLEELDIDCGSGDITAQTLSGNEISIDCGSGDIKMDTLSGKDVSIDCGSVISSIFVFEKVYSSIVAINASSEKVNVLRFIQFSNVCPVFVLPPVRYPPISLT